MKKFLESLIPVDSGRSKIRKALALSEEKNRTVFEYTGTGMVIVEDDMTITAANRRICEATGYTQEEITGKVKWTELVAPEDRSRLISYHRQRRKDSGGIPSQYEFKYCHKNGTIIDVLVTVSMIPGTTQSLVSMMDISEQKRIERTARDNEKKFRDLFENANDIIYVHDMSGNFTSANTAALNTFGYTYGEVMQLNIEDIVDKAYLGLTKEHIDKVRVQMRSEPYQLLTHKKNGEPVWIEVRTRIILHDGKETGIQGIARDITERKKIEEQLIESQMRFKETADLLPSIICELGTDMICTYVNKIGLDKFGFTQEDMARGFHLEDAVAPFEIDRVKRNINSLLAGNPSKLEEYVFVHRDGTSELYFITSSVMERDGRIVGFRICMIDVSRRKEMEGRLRRSEEQFRSLYGASPIGIALFDEQGKFIDANGSFRGMFNLPDGVDYATIDFSLFEQIPEVKQHKNGLSHHTTMTFESAHDFKFVFGNNRYECIAAGNRYLDWHITPVGLMTEDKRVFLTQVLDITEKKRAEEARLTKAQRDAFEANKTIEGLRKEIFTQSKYQNMVSRSKAMQEIFSILPEIAQADTTVLITGESGTGKELVARSIHLSGCRKDKPFITINCGALPDTLLESELFGYKAGAFTDAKKDKPGKFALADGGTLLLDEIGDISPAMQVKLLRVLQERVFEPLGATHSVSVNVRVVAATNKNLPEMIKNGQFREDLYYRIKVLKFVLPPLRDRKCDIPLLCDYFISLYNSRFKKNITEVSSKALDILLSHHYPGNIRELQNILEHAFIFCKGPVIEPHHLPAEIVSGKINTALPENVFDAIGSFEELEKLYLIHVLKQVGGSKIKAAEKLKVHKTTLFRKIKILGIDDQDTES